MTTVLIVDDEALAIQAIRRSINWKNLDVDRVLDAANGVEAQKILRQEPVQVLVCDLEMPRMSGIELLEWMKTSCPDTEAVILTCHESFPMAQKAMELGCVEYVLKPIAPAELTASIRHALNLWKTQESMRGTRRAYENGRSLRRDQYLQDVLEKNILSTAESLFNCAQKYDLELDVSAPLQVVRVLVQMPAALPQSEQELLGYGVCNIAKELWDKTGTGWTSLQRRSGQFSAHQRWNGTCCGCAFRGRIGSGLQNDAEAVSKGLACRVQQHSGTLFHCGCAGTVGNEPSQGVAEPGGGPDPTLEDPAFAGRCSDCAGRDYHRTQPAVPQGSTGTDAVDCTDLDTGAPLHATRARLPGGNRTCGSETGV